MSATVLELSEKVQRLTREERQELMELMEDMEDNALADAAEAEGGKWTPLESLKQDLSLL